MILFHSFLFYFFKIFSCSGRNWEQMMACEKMTLGISTIATANPSPPSVVAFTRRRKTTASTDSLPRPIYTRPRCVALRRVAPVISHAEAKQGRCDIDVVGLHHIRTNRLDPVGRAGIEYLCLVWFVCSPEHSMPSRKDEGRMQGAMLGNRAGRERAWRAQCRVGTGIRRKREVDGAQKKCMRQVTLW